MLALLLVLLMTRLAAIDAYLDTASLEYLYESNDGALMDYNTDRDWESIGKVARVDKSTDSLVLRLSAKIQNLARDIEDLAQQLKNAEGFS